MDRTVTRVLSGAGAGGRRRADRTPPSEAGPPTELDRARAALSRRDWDEARQILEPLIAADPHGPGMFLLARTEFESGHTNVAAAMLDDFLARRPRHQRARALRARVHLAARDHAAAQAEAEEALRIEPGLVAARRVLFDIAMAERLRAQASRRTT